MRYAYIPELTLSLRINQSAIFSLLLVERERAWNFSKRPKAYTETTKILPLRKLSEKEALSLPAWEASMTSSGGYECSNDALHFHAFCFNLFISLLSSILVSSHLILLLSSLLFYSLFCSVSFFLVSYLLYSPLSSVHPLFTLYSFKSHLFPSHLFPNILIFSSRPHISSF